MITHADSFDIYGTTSSLLSGVYTGSTGCTLSSTQPRTGTYSLRIATTGILQKIIPTGSVIGIAYAIRLDSLPGSNQVQGLMSFQDTNDGAQISVWVNTSGNIEVRFGDSTGPVLATSVIPISALTYVHFEGWVFIDGTNGYFKLAMGTDSGSQSEIINLSGINTDRTGAGPATTVIVAQNNTGASGIYLDDLVIYDNGDDYNAAPYNGLTKVIALVPDADTSTADWAKSTGVTGYTLVNASPPDDTKWISTQTPLAKSQFTTTNLGYSPKKIKGVVVLSRQKQDVAGAATTRVDLVTNSQTVTGTTRSLTTSFGYYLDIFQTDPNTGGKWNVTDINGLNIRITRAS